MSRRAPGEATGRSHGPPVRAVIGERLREAGIVTEAHLQEALVEHGLSGERLGSVLIRMKFATEREVAEALADQLGLACLDLSKHPPPVAAVTRIPKEMALKHACIAVAIDRNVLTVAMSDPLLFTLVQDIEFQTGCRVVQVVATREHILEAICRSYPDTTLMLPSPSAAGVQPRSPGGPPLTPAAEGHGTGGGDTVTAPSDRGERSTSDRVPVVEMVDLLIRGALRSGASDIHVEPAESGVVVRHRLDGLLKEAMDLPRWLHEGLVSRIKIMAGLDIAEKRLPQDGRIRVSADDGQDIDLRVSTLRTILGEKVVLRVLDHRKGVPPLEALGLSDTALGQVKRFLRRQHGMILVVGPTGSGKTTTLSSALAAIRSERTNIVTIEDPVEYRLSGVNQTQVNGKIDLTFASSLRAILRQDPDVVLVGEIRDQDTARIAMQAAQTGHLVLSTLHTDDAPSSVLRLLDMGIEPYVSASALIGVIAQRLIRRLCSLCRQPYTPEPETLRALGVPEAEAETSTFYRAVGCEQCHQTGYRGRVGVYEIMPVTDDLRRLIVQHEVGIQLRAAALAAGMLSLSRDGMLKVKAGITTLEELCRVVTEGTEPAGACSRCGGHIAPDFAVCPACGHRVGGGCMHCGRPLQTDWRYCPYCAGSTRAAVGGQRSRRGLRAVR